MIVHNKIICTFLFIGLLTSASFCHAESFIDDAIEIFSEYANREKPVETDPNFTITLPNDLPKHWKLRAFKEHVFGGEILVAEVGDQAKPSVFLIHGLGVVGMRDWLSVVPALEKDYHVVLIDLPGFGVSSTPAGKYSPRNYARVIAEVKASIVPNKKIKLVGHSMGGAVTLRFAHKYPQYISNIVLVDAAGILERTAFLKHNASLSEYVSVSPGKLRQLLKDAEDIGHNIIEVINTYPDVTRFLVTESTWAAVFGRRSNINAAFALIEENFGGAMEEIKIPVGMIWGGRDTIAPLRTGKLLDYHLSDSSLLVIAGAEHMPMKSHTRQFNNYLQLLLRTDTFGSNEKPQVAIKSDSLVCKDKDGGTYQGGYKHIEIDNCNNIKLENINTQVLSIKNSDLEIENIRIESDDVALIVDNSNIQITNMNIKAKVGILADNSRMDIAGAEINARQVAASVTRESRFVFSLSQINSEYFRGRVHKLYEVENASLDNQL